MDDDRRVIARLHRRAGLGLHPHELAALTDGGVDAALDALVVGDGSGPPDPWDRDVLAGSDRGAAVTELIGRYVEHLVTTAHPHRDRMVWMLHGWLVSGLDKAAPWAMAAQFDRFWRLWPGDMRTLLAEITVDAAMLQYLDGAGSSAASPNENYSRELLELFALGVGNYSEADVAAGAAALTGWVVRPRFGTVAFVPRRHDGTPRRYLGVDGVSDVDGVIDAVVAHPEHPRFVARRIASELVGHTGEDLVADLAATYTGSGRRLGAVVARALEHVVGGDHQPVVLAPIPWFVVAVRATGARPFGVLRGELGAAGQVPMRPPSVAGWPGGTAWFSTASLVARARVAAVLAAATDPEEPVHVACATGDHDQLADLLGVGPWSGSTRAALDTATDPVERLTVALVSPEMMLA